MRRAGAAVLVAIALLAGLTGCKNAAEECNEQGGSYEYQNSTLIMVPIIGPKGQLLGYSQNWIPVYECVTEKER